jgi:hypothetical protein
MAVAEVEAHQLFLVLRAVLVEVVAQIQLQVVLEYLVKEMLVEILTLQFQTMAAVAVVVRGLLV